MEFSAKGQRNTLIFAVVTLVIIGFSLIASTWQILRQQQESGVQYLAMSARSISQTVENTFRRHWRMEGHQTEFWQRMGEFFSDLETNSEIIFIEILDDSGRAVFEARRAPSNMRDSSGRKPPPLPPLLTPENIQQLSGTGEWYGVRQLGHESVFVFGTRITKIGAMRHRRSTVFEDGGAYMLIGLSMAANQGMHDSFKHNALLQSAYILAAAIFIWAMAVSLISRRAIVGKARMLERFQDKLLDNLPDGLLTVNSDNEIQAANPAAHMLLGFSEGSMVGKKVTDLPPAFVDSLQLESAPVSGCSCFSNKRRDIGWRQAEVQGKQLEILLSSYNGEHDEIIRLLLFRDRTRLHSLERSLAEAEKMAAVGTLAAGVAHEIRNPLSALRGFAQYFAKKFAGTKPDEEFANTMVREADRLNRVITDLLYLSRNKATESVPVDPSAVVRDVQQLLSFDLEGRGVALDVQLEAGEILADPDSVKQAVLNLVLNSLDALAEKKDLLAAGNFVLDGTEAGGASGWAPRVSIRSRNESGWVVLEVEDNGAGMSDEQRRQAFEAFYTSKGKGTGLGLSLVNKTVHEHGGRASIESEAGHWCRVLLYFLPAGENTTADNA